MCSVEHREEGGIDEKGARNYVGPSATWPSILGAVPPRDSWPGGGEVAIGISFVHGVIDQVLKGFPLNYGAPSDGTGYEIGGLSLGTIAIRFIHWALTPDAQRLAAERGESYQIQSNSKTQIPKVAPRFEDFHVIKYDNLKYGDAKVRDALIGRLSIV